MILLTSRPRVPEHVPLLDAGLSPLPSSFATFLTTRNKDFCYVSRPRRKPGHTVGPSRVHVVSSFFISPPAPLAASPSSPACCQDVSYKKAQQTTRRKITEAPGHSRVLQGGGIRRRTGERRTTTNEGEDEYRVLLPPNIQ